MCLNEFVDGFKKDCIHSCMSYYIHSHLVTIVVRLVWSILWHAQVLGLHFAQFGQLHVQVIQMRRGDLFIEL